MSDDVEHCTIADQGVYGLQKSGLRVCTFATISRLQVEPRCARLRQPDVSFSYHRNAAYF